MPQTRSVVIACGGTGGHLFPGLAVAEALQRRSCDVTLMISPKEVDQQGVKSAAGLEILTLPAIGLHNGAWRAFFRGFWDSYRLCLKRFASLRPQAVLAMGGFTSAPPILAGRSRGAAAFLHESNAIPGRANRCLSFVADEVFLGFSTAARGLFAQTVRFTGTPVRPQFQPTDPAACRISLGLNPNQPVLLVMGGSQGAHGINDLVLRAIPTLGLRAPHLQFIHLTGTGDKEMIETAYKTHNRRAVVRPFLTEMELALGAATLAVSRAGASSLAELASMRLPAILIPYPKAADNHQFHNARALVETGAAQLLNESRATPELLIQSVVELIENTPVREAMIHALERWFFPNAAEQIAERILETIVGREPEVKARRDETGQSFREEAVPSGRSVHGAKDNVPPENESLQLGEGRKLLLNRPLSSSKPNVA